MLKLVEITVALLAACGLVAVFLANPDPMLREQMCNWGSCFRSDHAVFWNTLAYDIGLGLLLSTMFYWLLVKLPDVRKRRRLRRHLQASYRRFRREITIQLLFATTESRSVSYDLVDKISLMAAFRSHFKEPSTQVEGNRWHDVANGINSSIRDDIAVAMTIFRDDVSYVLNNTEVDDELSFETLHQLQRMVNIVVLNPMRPDDDRNLLSFLWQVMAGWDWVKGYPEQDRFQRIIDRI